jgi:hypothetical protein
MAQYPIVPRPGGSLSSLNVSAKTAIKASSGTVYRVVVNAAATAGTFGIYDAATTTTTAADQIFVATASWPAAGTVLYLEFPCANGIVVDPGTGGNVSVSYA